MKDEEISKENLNIGIEKNNFKLIERNWLINKNSEENKISQINGNTFEIFPFIDILEYENPRISKIMKLEKGKNIRNKNYQNTRDYLKKLNKAIIEQESKMNSFKDSFNYPSEELFLTEGYNAFEAMFEEKEFIESLKERNFDLALFDTINIGALFVFYAVGIKNVFAINNTPLLLHQFYFANKPIPYDTVPDVYITVVNDPEQRKQNYNNIINAFKNFYSDIGQKFNKNHPQINMPTIGNLYSKIKALFLNTDEVIDFPLGESKPNNLYYVGGIHLNNDFRIKLANLIGKEKYKSMLEEIKQTIEETYYNHQIDRRTQILINLDNCEQIFEGENRKLMKVFIKLSEKFLNLNDSEIVLSEKIKLIYNCKINLKENINEDEEEIEKIKNEIEKLEKEIENNHQKLEEINGDNNKSKEKKKETQKIYNKNSRMNRKIKENENKIFYSQVNLKYISNIQEELAKGKTRIIITNCSGYKVIEAIAFNVGIFCFPLRDEQSYVLKSLKNNYDNFQKEENEKSQIDTGIEEIQPNITLRYLIYGNNDFHYNRFETAILKMFKTK